MTREGRHTCGQLVTLRIGARRQREFYILATNGNFHRVWYCPRCSAMIRESDVRIREEKAA